MYSHHSTIRRAEPAEAQAITEMVVRSKAYWGYSEEFMRYAAAILNVLANVLVGTLAVVVGWVAAKSLAI